MYVRGGVLLCNFKWKSIHEWYFESLMNGKNRKSDNIYPWDTPSVDYIISLNSM